MLRGVIALALVASVHGAQAAEVDTLSTTSAVASSYLSVPTPEERSLGADFEERVTAARAWLRSLPNASAPSGPPSHEEVRVSANYEGLELVIQYAQPASQSILHCLGVFVPVALCAAHQNLVAFYRVPFQVQRYRP